ncbi:MAG: host attachment protein [Enhydrobacter sp.]|nr:host attachment protein [Enhydrobacter sp.]
MTKQVMKPRRTSRLPQAPDLKARHRRTWIVVADGSRARFFEPGEDSRTLAPTDQTEMTAAEARRPARDLVTDKPGRGFASAGSDARHAFEPPHDIHKMQKHDFTARLAGVLDKACEEGRFDRLVLVAPPRSLGELRTLLSDRVKKTVAHEVGKDLTGAAPTAVRELLAGMLPPTALR